MKNFYLNIFFCYFYFLLILFSCKSKYSFKRDTVSEFQISNYIFEVRHIIKIDNNSGQVVKDYNDTILVNLCDFYEEFKECEEDGFF